MIRACPCCGLAQTLPEVPAGWRACCGRCGSGLRIGRTGTRARTAALALAALVLYPLAVTLPVMGVERFGHRHETGILEGVAGLLASRHVVIGLVVLVCSVILPVGKLLALLVLSADAPFLTRRHKSLTYHIVEFTGRWGMLDVMLVAVLVAAIKIGDMVTVEPGPGALAFSVCVILSLLASASFDPHRHWEDADG